MCGGHQYYTLLYSILCVHCAFKMYIYYNVKNIVIIFILYYVVCCVCSTNLIWLNII